MDAAEVARAAPDQFDRFCRRIATGKENAAPELERELSRRVAHAGDMPSAAIASRRLAVYRRAEVAALERMTPEERLMRYRKGQLTVRQGWAWWQRHPKEVPTVDGQPEWLARTLCDVVDARRTGPLRDSSRQPSGRRRRQGRGLEVE